MTRWKLTIEYRGCDYAGWQCQADGVPSVQQAVEAALHAFCGQAIRVHAAGRTDAGVHAYGQVAHLDLDYGARPLSGFVFAKALNAHLRRHSIAVVQAEKEKDDFHARFGALNKLYRYRIINRSAPPAVERGLAWHIRKPLDSAAMREAAQCLIGRHDFTTFRDSACQSKSPVKTLKRLDVTVSPYQGGQEIRVEAEAQSFLHHQVRNMVGTLTLTGHGKWTPRDVKAALEARDRTKGGPTAPAQGLYLMRVDYA